MAGTSPRRILVTGAGGFVGRHLLLTLAEAMPQAEVTPSTFDITDPAAIQAAVDALRPDGCVHLAAIAAVPTAQSDPDAAWQVNLHGTLNLARALAAAAPGCALVYASTADSYGRSFARGTPLDEDAPLAPINTYGATKAAADLALGAMAKEGLRIIRVRPFNHTGAGQAPSFVVAAFARQLARIAAGLQPPVLHVGALDPQRDFLDVRDVCHAYALCLLKAGDIPSGTVLNVASGVPRRIGDVLDDLVRLSGLQVQVETDTARLRGSDIPTATGDSGVIRALLGWQPGIPWDHTVAAVLDDWRQRVTESNDA